MLERKWNIIYDNFVMKLYEIYYNFKFKLVGVMDLLKIMWYFGYVICLLFFIIYISILGIKNNI